MKTYSDPYLKRLSMDYFMLQELASNSDIISFNALNGDDTIPPSEYEIIYDLNSIIAINDSKMPIFGNRHIAKISMTKGYPMLSPPSCYMLTDTWHPNIRSSGNLKGHICINAQVLGTWYTLDLLVLQIGEMLQYKNYHAKNIQPFPEDPIVANWVTEFAEPQGIVDKSKFIFVDDQPLIRPTKSWIDTRKMQKINILSVKIRNSDTSNSIDSKSKKSIIINKNN
jgi:ubiquitin-protein ligase